ncbi:putative SnoaL-like aldol condensation-catalyzing enzyme [Flavobacterium sp. HSC-32F16]|uniref:nuclear transport factor 2 family protein n=1 Tax=Flavobacterium sp. HSC-32F16 TaxID=2910964 RepID=UPI0020A38838|nr:ester cyclase [Flavobacterium sp. HSC-32F16]MCP2028942.1 putative SnoaL-like aldol condensation-catalyzing enzyme [Flavobacterium sp. HSC-32F16]
MTKKEIAQNFLKLAANGHPHEAFRLHVSKDFKHHNAYFKGDADTLMLAMEESARKNPNKIFNVHHILEEDNIVAVHSHLKQTPADAGFAVVHILKFKADKIIELWDLGQQIPTETVNENGIF